MKLAKVLLCQTIVLATIVFTLTSGLAIPDESSTKIPSEDGEGELVTAIRGSGVTQVEESGNTGGEGAPAEVTRPINPDITRTIAPETTSTINSDITRTIASETTKRV